MDNPKVKKWIILSPDGFPIHPIDNYRSQEGIDRALDEFVKRFEHQGYYSMSDRTRLPLNEIRSKCKIKEI